MYAPWGAGGMTQKKNRGTEGSGLGCHDKTHLLIWLALLWSLPASLGWCLHAAQTLERKAGCDVWNATAAS